MGKLDKQIYRTQHLSGPDEKKQNFSNFNATHTEFVKKITWKCYSLWYIEFVNDNKKLYMTYKSLYPKCVFPLSKYTKSKASD